MYLSFRLPYTRESFLLFPRVGRQELKGRVAVAASVGIWPAADCLTHMSVSQSLWTRDFGWWTHPSAWDTLLVTGSNMCRSVLFHFGVRNELTYVDCANRQNDFERAVSSVITMLFIAKGASVLMVHRLMHPDSERDRWQAGHPQKRHAALAETMKPMR